METYLPKPIFTFTHFADVDETKIFFKWCEELFKDYSLYVIKKLK